MTDPRVGTLQIIRSKSTISVVVPVYNEAHSIPLFLTELIPTLRGLGMPYEVIFAVDPSTDETEHVLEQAHASDPCVKYVIFSRRIGQPLAVIAGMTRASGDAVVVMDVDLQDPPSLLPAMVEKWREGFDVVIPQRRTRGKEPWIRSVVARIGYRLINRLADVEIPENCGEFRLLSRRVTREVVALKESHGFLRGLVALVGFKQCTIPFDRCDRAQGTTKYNAYVGSLKVGFNGVFCFSTYALTLSTKLGFLIAVMAFALSVVYLSLKIFGFPFPLGNPSLAILILFLGGIQLVSVGILGEYIGRIYQEVRERPKFIEDKVVGFESLDKAR